jgi:hypothetical protein
MRPSAAATVPEMALSGGLVGAVGPHDGDELALGHLERHAGERVQAALVHAEAGDT